MSESYSPFTKMEFEERKVKLFLYGEPGVLKTRTALKFPGPIAMIDLEKGSQWYRNEFEFDTLEGIDSPDDVFNAIYWLKTNENKYQTIILDPFTVYYERLKDKWMKIFHKRNKGKAGDRYDFYILQPGDYPVMNNELFSFVRLLISLDKHIVCIARQKALYSDSEMMKKIGDTYDAQKSIPYEFDTIIRFYKKNKDIYCYCEKDRSHKIPEKEDFKYDWTTIEKALFNGNTPIKDNPFKSNSEPAKTITETVKGKLKGIKIPGRKQKEEKQHKNSNIEEKEQETEIKELMINQDQINKIINYLKGKSESEISKRLQELYNVNNIPELTFSQAVDCIRRLENNLKNNNGGK